MYMIDLLGLIGYGILQASLIYFLDTWSSNREYKKYLKEYRNKLKNIVE